MHVSRMLTILRPRRPSRLCTPRLSLFCKMCSRESSNEYSWLSGFREQKVSTMSEATAFITCTFPLNCLYPLSTSVPDGNQVSIRDLIFNSLRNEYRVIIIIIIISSVSFQARNERRVRNRGRNRSKGESETEISESV